MAVAETAEREHGDRSVTDLEATAADAGRLPDAPMAAARLASPPVATVVMPGSPVRRLSASGT
jgi:hypothetical protein